MWRWLLAAILVLVFFASSVAAFGRGATIVGGPCLVALSVIWIWRNGGKHAFAAILVVLTAMTVYTLLSPAVSGRRETDRRAYCANNLHSIALALLSYEKQHGCFPPAYVCDKDGKPMHSWRVLLLPYMHRDDAYKKYNFNEPWNGPNNRLLGEDVPPAYRCPSAERAGANWPPLTSVVVVTGPNTAFPGCKSRRLKEITDGDRDTVLVVEVANSDIHWMEPRDPSLEDLLASKTGKSQVLTSHHVVESYWLNPSPSPGNVACADGSVQLLRGPISTDDAKALLTVNGGEALRIDDLVQNMPLVGRLRWDHIIGLPLFGVSLVALLVLALTTPRRERQLAPEGSSPTVEPPP